jgi:hypothetical protein
MNADTVDWGRDSASFFAVAGFTRTDQTANQNDRPTIHARCQFG